MTRQALHVRGDLVLHPVALAGLVVLLLNDHVLKAAAPSWVTGKLSDVAGLAFFPFLLLAGWEVLTGRTPTVRAASSAGATTAVVFAAVKLSDVARDAYADVVGVLRLPVDAVLSGASAPVDVVIQPDATDLLALVSCAAVVLVVRQSVRRTSASAVVRAAGAASGTDAP